MSEKTEKSIQKVKVVVYDENNIMEVIKLLNGITVTGIEQCATMTNIAQRLNSFIKQEEMEIED